MAGLHSTFCGAAQKSLWWMPGGRAIRAHLPVVRDYDVLFTTGPDVVSEVVARARPRFDLIVIDREQGLRHVTHLQRGTWRQDPRA